MSPVQVDRDERGRMLHFTVKGAAGLGLSILSMLAIIGSAFWWLMTTSADAVTAWDQMKHSLAVNTEVLSEIKQQMAADRRDGNQALVTATEGLSGQISKISGRMDSLQDRTRMLEINQARVLEALKRQGIVNERSGQ